jgi:hypothetical protein
MTVILTAIVTALSFENSLNSSLNISDEILVYFYKARVLEKLKAQFGSSIDTNDPNFIDDNLLKVNVFFSDFTHTNIAESPDYPVSTCACAALNVT